MIRDAGLLLRRLRELHERVRDEIVSVCENTDSTRLGEVIREDRDDTIFAIDGTCDEVLRDRFEKLARDWPCVLIAEGLGSTGSVVLPAGTDPDRAELRIIVDPIDGTRGLIYQKRPAWILTGVAPNRGSATTLADIQLAVQTEIPLVKQHLGDTLWATAGQGVSGERLNRLTGERTSLVPCPSQAESVARGYGAVARFFPGGRDLLAAVDERVIERALGPIRPGSAPVFEDQYASTGGQLYELMMGHDRWIADLRPLVEPELRRRGQALGHCCHPYDVCTELIAREAGVLVTDEHGRQLAMPLDSTTDVSWIGYANSAVRAQIEPVLHDVLRELGLLAPAEVG